MTTPDEPLAANGNGARPPSLVPGVVLLVIAAILIIVVLVKPDMPQWLKVTIAVIAVLVVLSLLVYAIKVFRGVTRRGGTR